MQVRLMQMLLFQCCALNTFHEKIVHKITLDQIIMTEGPNVCDHD